LTSKFFLGIDAGGTFTDFCLVEVGSQVRVKIHKTLSTPTAPEQAIIQGIRALGLTELLESDRLHITHGSTVATNAALEGKLAATAYITNRGFKDVLTLARQTRPSLYQLEFEPIPAPVPEHLCLETGGRIGADGKVLEELTEADLSQLLQQLKQLKIEAVAINLLFSFVDASYEERIYQAIKKAQPELFVSRSSAVLPVYKEYERGIATWLNSALGPVVSGYIDRLQAYLGSTELQIMQSSGETLAAKLAAPSAANLLLSGPAGGLTALEYLGKQTGGGNFISFDMGGTSTDVALLEGAIEITSEGSVGPYPIGLPMVDMHTIGAGGGSIAFIDSGGVLKVGPESAGASPGPACYGKGGTVATVTDANVVLGRISAQTKLAGDLSLNLAAAIESIEPLAIQLSLSVEETAAGIIQLANQHMVSALRLISVNRGHDPRDFTLVCFGGAGGLHVCDLADLMAMDNAMVPVNGGVLSAFGMVIADRGRQFSRTLNLTLTPDIESTIQSALSELSEQASNELARELDDQKQSSEIVVSHKAELRYLGQSFTLTVPYTSLLDCQSAFTKLHHKRYGYSLSNPIQIVTLHVSPKIQTQSFDLPAIGSVNQCNEVEQVTVFGVDGLARFVRREELPQGEEVFGPAIIAEYAATTFVAPSWSAQHDRFGNLLMRRVTESAA
jgi:N-methylhydantoinase A